MRDTWYVLDDGVVADPSEVAPDKSGVLRHKSGVAVAMRGDVPSTRGVDPDEERKKPKAKAKAEDAVKANEPVRSTREMKAEDGKVTYKTR